MFKKLYAKYQNMAPPLKASLWFLICGFLQKGISMLTTPIYTRLMTEQEFGRNSVYNSWHSILFIIASLELAAGVYTRGLVKNEEKADAFSSALLSLSTVCIVAFSGVYFLFYKQFNGMTGLSTYLMVMMIIEMWATIAYQFWSNRERVAYRYKKLVALMLAYSILRPVAGIIAVSAVGEHYQVEARVTASVIVCLLLFGGLYISMMKKGKMFFDKAYWKYALCFNIPLIPHYLSQVVLNQSDRIMIDKICGASDAAYYSVAYSLSMVMLMFNSAVTATMNPWIYRSIKNKSYDRIGKISYSILLIIAGLNFMMVALGPELMKIMAPDSYYEAIWVIPPITVSVYFMFLYSLFATFEYYFHKTHLVMFASVIGAVLNIVLNLVFIPLFGFVAAGYTTLVSYILYAVMHYIFMRRMSKKYMDGYKVYDIKRIMLIGGALIVASAVMLLLYQYMVIRYIILVALFITAFYFRKNIVSIFLEIKK